MFISAACVAYYGAFTSTYREKLVSIWNAACKEAVSCLFVTKFSSVYKK